MVFGHTALALGRHDAAHDGDHGSLSVHAPVTSTGNCVPSKELFAPYQPLHRQPYDLSNPFHRTNLSIVIRGYIARCEDYIATARRQHRAGLKSTSDFVEHAGKAMADLREHRNALFRLNELGRN